MKLEGVTWGVHLSFLSPDLVEFLGALGFRWLFLDAQRTPLDLRSCRELVRAADVAKMFCMVRIAEINVPAIESYLDAGVRGILAPNVDTPAQARALVEAVKFPPQGTRGAAMRTRAAEFGFRTDFYAESNAQTFTAALIESQQGLDSLEAIAAVPGLNYLSIGANDLGLSLGRSGAELHTIVEDANRRIRATGQSQLAVVSDPAQAHAAITSGVRLIAVSDAALIAASSRKMLEITARDETPYAAPTSHCSTRDGVQP